MRLCRGGSGSGWIGDEASHVVRQEFDSLQLIYTLEGAVGVKHQRHAFQRTIDVARLVARLTRHVAPSHTGEIRLHVGQRHAPAVLPKCLL